MGTQTQTQGTEGKGTEGTEPRPDASNEFATLAARLGAMHGTLTRADAKARWRFAQQLMVNRGKAGKRGRAFDEAVGAACAKAVGRAKAYASSWVRQNCAAAAKFPNEPADAQTAAAFLEALNGNKSRKDKPAEAKGGKRAYTGAELLARVTYWAKRAVADGGVLAAAVESAARDGIAQAATRSNGKPVAGAKPIKSELGAAVIGG